MKYESRDVDADRKIVRITTTDERWYSRPKSPDSSPFDPDGCEFVPSVTWITDHYPKGPGFARWLASKGWDEAEAIKHSRGDKGSRVHYACNALLAGEIVTLATPFHSELTDSDEPLIPEEYAAVLSFADWYESGKCPRCEKRGCFEVVDFDYVVWNDRLNYAGTVDLKVRLRCCGLVLIVDLKTSKAVYESHRAQVCAYRKADPQTAKGRAGQAILQLGYAANKHQKYKLTLVPNSDWQLFLTARRVWKEQSANQTPHQKDYPLSIRLKDRAPVNAGVDTEVLALAE